MTNAILQVLLNIVIIFGSVTVISIVGVGILLGLDKLSEKWKERKKK